jgi:hypothetical protein
LYRSLARERPVFSKRLAHSLHTLSSCYLDLGRQAQEEANRVGQ